LLRLGLLGHDRGAGRPAFDDDELAQLVFAITAITDGTAWNITSRLEPGHYQPERSGEAAA